MTRNVILSASVALLGGVLAAVAALGDTVVLKNGSRVQGDLKKTDDGWQVTSPDGKVTSVASADIKSVEAGGKSPTQAMGLLQSLRRSVENVNDLRQIIERYKRFIELNPGSQAADDAKKDLAEWQDRLDRGFVKSGNKWVSAKERDQLMAHATDDAMKARDLIMQGRAREAEAILQGALDVDPNNIAALYLRGVLQWRQDQVGQAKKTFESLNGMIADHAPTLNNLAVILARQNQAVASAAMLEQALAAAPLDRVIIDNAAEVLHALPEENRKAQAVLKLSRRFGEQDTNLQQMLAQQGLYRWGATWVDKTTLDRVRVAEKDIKDKLDRLNADYESTKLRREQIGPEIQSRADSMRQIESQSVALQPDGTVVRFPLPPYYYTLQDEIVRLRSELTAIDLKLENFKAQARRIQQEMPVPQYTGVLKVIDVEGAPLPPPAAPNMPKPAFPQQQRVLPTLPPGPDGIAPPTQNFPRPASTRPATYPSEIPAYDAAATTTMPS